jgi:hypothetical protein
VPATRVTLANSHKPAQLHAIDSTFVKPVFAHKPAFVLTEQPTITAASYIAFVTTDCDAVCAAFVVSLHTTDIAAHTEPHMPASKSPFFFALATA